MRPGAHLCQGDARAIPLADASVQCVVTSPPYWGLRDYGVAGQLGLEPTPEAYVADLVAIFREVRRVLRADGTVWLNLGDSYNGSGPPGGPGKQDTNLGSFGTTVKSVDGLKPKDLVGIPWRVAFALQADGWWLRSDIIWAKPNPMPESITDRPTKAHEYVFLLTKSARYYYDGEAIKEPLTEEWSPTGKARTVRPGIDVHGGGQGIGRMEWSATGRNRRSVWTIATEPYPEAHFATFPEKLVEPCILAGTSARGACPVCGAPWARAVDVESRPNRPTAGPGAKSPASDAYVNRASVGRDLRERVHRGWAIHCTCPPAEPMPCRVLDPFAGSGTTVAVAERLGRVGIGFDLNPAYLRLARWRTVQAGLL